MNPPFNQGSYFDWFPFSKAEIYLVLKGLKGSMWTHFFTIVGENVIINKFCVIIVIGAGITDG